MKRYYIVICLFLCSLANAAGWMTSFDDAKKLALGTNKFIIVDFWATWCGPCKKMEKDSWNSAEVQTLLENYIAVKIDIDRNKTLANQYGIQSIPNMFILDGNGKVVYTFDGYHDAKQLKRELEKFAMSTEFLSVELINRFKASTFANNTILAQKYCEFSLDLDNSRKNSIIKLSSQYIDDAKSSLSKKDADYAEKLQTIELLELYEYAYKQNFEKLSKKLTEFTEDKIAASNTETYYFLKLVAAKGMKSEDTSAIEDHIKELPSFDVLTKKADILASKQS